MQANLLRSCICMINFPNCKINIGLQIISKRKDGFHNIETLFVPVKDLRDIFEIQESTHFQFACSGIASQFLSKNNICVRAYELLRADYDLPPVNMYLHKCIPTAAGLGGGSSDGTHTLLLLNKLFDLQLDKKIIKSYAEQLGSDCAFFVDNEVRIGSEKGNVLTPIELYDLVDKYVYIIKPPIYISTPQAYAMAKVRKPSNSLKSLLLKPIYQWKNNVFNDFEKWIFPNYPALDSLKEQLYQHGAIYASMSGSGSSVYGIFDNIPEKINSFSPDYFQWIGKL